MRKFSFVPSFVYLSLLLFGTLSVAFAGDLKPPSAKDKVLGSQTLRSTLTIGTKADPTVRDIRCDASSSGTCHYRFWNVTRRDQSSPTNTNVTQEEQIFSLKVGDTRSVKPALAGSFYCQDSDRTPDEKTCTRSAFNAMKTK